MAAVVEHEAGRVWKPRDDACYKEPTERKWRAAVVLQLEGDDGAHILYADLAGHVDKRHCNVCLLRAPATVGEAELERLRPMWVKLHADPGLEGKKPPKPAEAPVRHEPYYLRMQRLKHFANKITDGHVRVLSWNVKHYGAVPPRDRAKRSAEERERLEAQKRQKDDERARNLVEVVFQSRCALVVLQEISPTARLDVLCALLSERSRSEWRPTRVIGEHAMLYQPAVLAAALHCADVVVEAGPYEANASLSSTFRRATDWDGPRRFDYKLQGSKGARLPSLFFVRDASLRADRSRRSIYVCSVHFAFGDPTTRDKQLEHLASLVPGRNCSPGECMSVLLGDFNSDASVRSPGHDIADSEIGERMLAALNESAPGHVLALRTGQKTSIGGSRYDEMILRSIALGRRHAHVFPRLEEVRPHMQEALPEFEQEKASSLHMAFCNIFSDHLAVFVDLAFVAEAKPAAAPDEARLPEPEPEPEPTLSPGTYRCALCSHGKGCRWRGREGHRPRAPG